MPILPTVLPALPSLFSVGWEGEKGRGREPGTMPGALLHLGMTAGKHLPGIASDPKDPPCLDSMELGCQPSELGPISAEQAQKHTHSDITLCHYCHHCLCSPQPLQAGAGAAGPGFRGQPGAGNPPLTVGLYQGKSSEPCKFWCQATRL